jgi:hypothetical protein
MYFKGTDFEFTDPAEVIPRDFDQERFSGDLRFDFRLDDRSTLIVNGGASRMASSIEMTGIGAAQALDWTYSYVQARFNRGSLFAQAQPRQPVRPGVHQHERRRRHLHAA